MDNEKILEEIRRFCDPYSIFVIYKRSLYKVTCPFRVRLLVDVAGWHKGKELWVQRVMVTRSDLQMIYLIGGNGYHYYLFQILLR